MSKTKPATILVVEDVEMNQYIVSKMLQNMGHSVDVANDGAQALLMLSAKRYDLVFMDINLPVLDGFAATAAIRKNQGEVSDIPIVAMTAAGVVRGDRDKCLRAGMDDYLEKPIQEDELYAIMSRQWDMKQGTAPDNVTPLRKSDWFVALAVDIPTFYPYVFSMNKTFNNFFFYGWWSNPAVEVVV